MSSPYLQHRSPRGADRVSRRFPGAHAVVTGGAGFLGAHLCRALVAAGLRVTALDNLITGRRANVADLEPHPAFDLYIADVIDHIEVAGEVDLVLHLASPASPIDYLRHPIHTLKVGALGTHNALGLAKASGARFLLASTSEVYGDPEVHPQPERYLGNVDQTSTRGVYDEAKRFAEAITYAYHRTHGVDVRVARIFNTYGPGMRADDGRLVPTVIDQALRGAPLTVHGDGEQTRSLCYVDDLIDGLLCLLASDYTAPVNLGSDHEVTVRAIVVRIAALVGSSATLQEVDRPAGDPARRRPDLTVARRVLDWDAEVALDEGLARTIASMRGTTPKGGR